MVEPQFQQLLTDFTLDSRERLDHLEALLLNLPTVAVPEREQVLDEIRRELHTLKGNAGMMRLQDFQSLVHELEDYFGNPEFGPAETEVLLTGIDSLRRMLSAESEGGQTGDNRKEHADERYGSIRIPFAAIDEIVDRLSEMVIFRNRLSDCIATGRNRTDLQSAWDDVATAHEALGKTLGFIQERVMRMGMVPLQTIFGHLQRIVFDEARKNGKEARFETAGGETPLDKVLLEVASAALGHLVRNAVVHGIEPPAARLDAGKSRAGTVSVSAVAQSNQVQNAIEDDGRGIDRGALLQLAAARGLDPQSPQELLKLLFTPGVSTQTDIDMSAGRGLGLSAAREAVQRSGGSIEVDSVEGRGTRFLLRLPLSLSITSALLVRTDNEDYALPLSDVIESLHFRGEDGHRINHAGTYRWRNSLIPLLDLGLVFGTCNSLRSRGYVVLIETNSTKRALLVDDLIGMREIVVKGLDSLTGNPPGVSGSTILGDGRVVLILDAKELAGVQPFVSDCSN